MWTLLADAGIVSQASGAVPRLKLAGIRDSPREILRTLRAMALEQYEPAALGATGVLNRYPDNVPATAVRRAAQNQLGNTSAELAAVRSLVRLTHRPRVQQAEAMVAGRLREIDPRWMPDPGLTATPLEPRADNVVMHLLKTSGPHEASGYTVRSRQSLLVEREAGLEPFVVTSLGFPRGWGVERFERVEVVDGVRHYRLDLGPSYSRFVPSDERLSTAAWLSARIARLERPAVINAGSGFRGYELALIGLSLQEHLGIPLVYEVRGFFEGTWTGNARLAEHGELFDRRLELEHRIMLTAAAVITISEAMREELVRRGIPGDRITVTPNGVDIERFASRPPDPALLARYGFAGRTVVGYVSTLDHPREHVEALIDAIAILRTRGEPVGGLVVGDGTRRAALERYAEAAGVGDAVVFTGRVPHESVSQYYALMDVFVVPRRDDLGGRFTTPLKPFEAMAMGRPVVASDLPALREITGGEQRGLLYPPGDASALAAALERLIADPGLRQRLGEAGRRWVVAERTWRQNGVRYRGVYDAVVGRAKEERATRGLKAEAPTPDA